MFPSRYDLNKPRVTWRGFWYELRDFVGFDETVQMRDMRHHFATIQLKESKDIATVSALLGHSNVATTSRHYAHVLQDTKQKLLKSTSKKFKVI
jgi:integrase